MAGLIEDYATIGNCETVALVGRDGSIDWLSLPRFDAAACFAAPAASQYRTSRRYREGSLILETEFETDEGTVVIVDCMGQRDTAALVDRLAGDEGVFLACSFWLADNDILQGRDDEARRREQGGFNSDVVPTILSEAAPGWRRSLEHAGL